MDSAKILLSFCWGPSRIPVRALENRSLANWSFCQDSASIIQMPTQSVKDSAWILLGFGQDSAEILLGFC